MDFPSWIQSKGVILNAGRSELERQLSGGELSVAVFSNPGMSLKRGCSS